jgi:ankyrin repeat protein
MSLPIATDNNNNNNAHGEIAQDAAKPGVNDRSPNSSDTSASNISALNQQVEWLALRLESLENAIRNTNDDTLPSHNNIAFIAEEEESTVESLTNDIVLPREVGNPDEGTVRRKKRSLFMRFCFFGGCK